jgi:hypothetical protein
VRRAGELLGVALLHAALWVWLAWDAVASGGTRVVGATNTETWPFLWGHSWMTRSLFEDGTWPYRTGLLDHPVGGVLWLKDPLLTAVLSPVTATLGAPVSQVVGGGLLLVLAGVAGFGLLRALGTSRVAAVSGALAFALCPHFLGEAYNGNPEAMAHGWMALWLWAFVALLRAPSAARAGGAAVALFLLFLGNQYFLLSMAAVSAFVLAGVVWARRGDGRTRARLGWTVAAVGLGVVLCLPVVAAMQASIAAPDHLTILNDEPLLYPPFTTDPVQLVAPFAELDRAPPNPFQDLVYPGWVAVLATVVAVAWRRDTWSVLALGVGTGFLVLSLGPYLLDGGAPVEVDGRYVGLPWFVLIQGKPVLGRMTLPHRLAMPAALGWGMGVALLLDRLCAKGAVGVVAAVVLGGGALAEIALVPGYTLPLATSPAERPMAARAIAQSGEVGGLLDLPLAVNRNDRMVALWYQDTHRQPLSMSLRVGELPRPLWDMPRALEEDEARAIPEDLREKLAAGAVRWVVFHPWMLDTRQAKAEWAAALDARLGPGQAFADGAVVYALDEAAAAALAGTPACAEACVGSPALDLRKEDAWYPPSHGGVTRW